MSTIETLMWGAPDPWPPTHLDPGDPFDDGYIQEAQFLDMRCDLATSTVAVLFDLRMTLHPALRESNAGVLIGRDMGYAAWRRSQWRRHRTCWTCVGSEFMRSPTELSFNLEALSPAMLEITATSFEFYSGLVEGIDWTPPDYGLPDDVVREEVPSWSSEFLIHAASRVDL